MLHLHAAELLSKRKLTTSTFSVVNGRLLSGCETTAAGNARSLSGMATVSICCDESLDMWPESLLDTAPTKHTITIILRKFY